MIVQAIVFIPRNQHQFCGTLPRVGCAHSLYQCEPFLAMTYSQLFVVAVVLSVGIAARGCGMTGLLSAFVLDKPEKLACSCGTETSACLFCEVLSISMSSQLAFVGTQGVCMLGASDAAPNFVIIARIVVVNASVSAVSKLPLPHDFATNLDAPCSAAISPTRASVDSLDVLCSSSTSISRTIRSSSLLCLAERLLDQHGILQDFLLSVFCACKPTLFSSARGSALSVPSQVDLHREGVVPMLLRDAEDLQPVSSVSCWIHPFHPGYQSSNPSSVLMLVCISFSCDSFDISWPLSKLQIRRHRRRRPILHFSMPATLWSNFVPCVRLAPKLSCHKMTCAKNGLSHNGYGADWRVQFVQSLKLCAPATSDAPKK